MALDHLLDLGGRPPALVEQHGFLEITTAGPFPPELEVAASGELVGERLVMQEVSGVSRFDRLFIESSGLLGAPGGTGLLRQHQEVAVIEVFGAELSPDGHLV